MWIPQDGLFWPTAAPTVVKLYNLIKHILKANIVFYQSSHVHQNHCSGSDNKELCIIILQQFKWGSVTPKGLLFITQNSVTFELMKIPLMLKS